MTKDAYPATNGSLYSTLVRAGFNPHQAWMALDSALRGFKRDHAGRPYLKIKGRRWLVTDRKEASKGQN